MDRVFRFMQPQLQFADFHFEVLVGPYLPFCG